MPYGAVRFPVDVNVQESILIPVIVPAYTTYEDGT
jgi:hypothetical protein